MNLPLPEGSNMLNIRSSQSTNPAQPNHQPNPIQPNPTTNSTRPNPTQPNPT